MSNIKAKKCAIIANYLSANDGRISKFAQALREASFEVTLISYVSKDGEYETIEGAILLDYRGAMQNRIWPALVIGALRGNLSSAPQIAQAAAKRALMEKALKEGQFDLVIATDPETLICAARAKAFGKFKLVYDAHEYYRDEVPNDAPRTAWVDKIHSKAAATLDGFITVNEEIAKEYRKTATNFPIPIVIHNAADRNDNLTDKTILRKAAGLNGDAKILLYQGGLSKSRGLEGLVRAFEFTPPNWHLIIMGAGPLEAELREIAGKMVVFLPPVPHKELYNWTAGADLGAILYEPDCINQTLCSPNKLWEYPAAMVPILATDLPYMGQKIRQNGIGVLVDPQANDNEIAIVIASLNGAELSKLRENCAAFVKNENWEIEKLRLCGYCADILGELLLQ